jgi:Protein of unknown function (DUF3352)
MSFPRLTAALAPACAALLLAACGGTTEKSGVSGDAGASLVRSGALAYVAVDSDLSSDQWEQVDDLLKKFPGHDTWIRRLNRSLKEGDPSLDYERDVKDALGPEVDVAVIAAASGKPAFALLTKPHSIDKAKALVRKVNEGDPDGEQAVSREVDGWLVVSTSDGLIDQVLKGSGSEESLADDASFKAAVRSLPTDALAKAYVSGRELGRFANSFLGGVAQPAAAGPNPLAPLGLDKLDWIGAALDAKGGGIRFQAGVKGAGARLTSAAKPYASTLLAGVPGDALAFLTFQGGTYRTRLGQLRENPQFGQGLRLFERQLGIRLDSLLTLFSHEVAFYVRRGAGLPELSLVLEAPDAKAALAIVDTLGERVAEEANTRIYTEQQAGLEVKSVGLSRVTVHWAGLDGRVLLTTGPTGIADYRAGGEKLGESPGYKDALEAAGAPEKTSGLAYLDLDDGLQLIQNSLAASGGQTPPDLAANLKPLRSFVAYATANGALAKAAAFLEIK